MEFCSFSKSNITVLESVDCHACSYTNVLLNTERRDRLGFAGV